jgi:5-methylcytosine-specific restriction endonuclease McrA
MLGGNELDTVAAVIIVIVGISTTIWVSLALCRLYFKARKLYRRYFSSHSSRSQAKSSNVKRKPFQRRERPVSDLNVQKQLERGKAYHAKGSFTLEQFKRKCAKYHWKCAYCDTQLNELTVTIEHVVPLSRGGTNNIDNLVPACSKCNNSKGAKLLSEWRRS